MSKTAREQFTGRHMAAILIAFFAVVVVVNFIMARLAMSTFGGVVVENSYVASQHFNRWLDQASQEKALGWKAAATHRSDGRVEVTLAGVANEGAQVKAIARHPLGRLPDQFLAFTRGADGRFVSQQALPSERWRLRIEVRAGGTAWRTEEDVR